ncbi:hypothetical protein DL89DRAFT_292099 [Linderina pennispora]|uniref:Uncharacterized protein n=1 Tax=Linderina pennispora TaxID=61395 RepID=A0A1Y1WDR0_9FUNG|nr:uncharacterized protein DL89DRAFT_292099 [Linderina pennispora]ORX71660.1 hypothetical protein DL89DRAFT_292099 [Linderina pennispora]
MSSWDQYFDHVTFDQSHIQNGIAAADLSEHAPEHINLKSSLQPTKKLVPQQPVYEIASL